jgi:hypothetical protein
VTLKLPDGSETSFVADAAVNDLEQLKKGYFVAVRYNEALAYDVRKSGKPGAETSIAISAARPIAGMACPGNAGAVEAQATDWPEPEPLTEPLESLPYPVEALPSMLREAVTEAQAFVQAPVALVVSSALSALSLAAQGVANVRRDHQLVGPVSLYLLAVADSGARKTTCDAILSPALRD